MQTPAHQQEAMEKQASAHAEAMQELSSAAAEGRNVDGILPNVQSLTLSQQRGLSQHRRLPSLSEHQAGSTLHFQSPLMCPLLGHTLHC